MPTPKRNANAHVLNGNATAVERQLRASGKNALPLVGMTDVEARATHGAVVGMNRLRGVVVRRLEGRAASQGRRSTDRRAAVTPLG